MHRLSRAPAAVCLVAVLARKHRQSARMGRDEPGVPRRRPGAAVYRARNRRHPPPGTSHHSTTRNANGKTHSGQARNLLTRDDPSTACNSSPQTAFGMLAGENDVVEVVEMMRCLDAESTDPTNEMIECMETKSRLLGRGHKPLAVFRSHAAGSARAHRLRDRNLLRPRRDAFYRFAAKRRRAAGQGLRNRRRPGAARPHRG